MGACGSKPSNGSSADNAPESAVSTITVDKEEIKKSKQIQRELKKKEDEYKKKFKLLLLGAGESGKSTVLKQMRILHGAAWTDDELKKYGVIIRSNSFLAMRKLCTLLKKLDLEVELYKEPSHSELGITPRQAYEDFCSYFRPPVKEAPRDLPEASKNDWVGEQPSLRGVNMEAVLFLHTWKAMKVLWESQTMRIVWQQRSLSNIIDGHKNFLDSLSRIASPDYKPTRQDILLSRVKTTQVLVERYEIEKNTLELYDVGGQRSERRKWLGCFDNMDAVIFVAAISEYDQALSESKTTNRMVEAIEVFRTVCRNKSFEKTPMVLFLNKKDVYAEKIQYSNISDQPPFQDYNGPQKDFTSGAAYFIEKFKECLNTTGRRDQYIHVTCATDTEQMKVVLESVRKNTLTANLEVAGMIGQL